MYIATLMVIAICTITCIVMGIIIGGGTSTTGISNWQRDDPRTGVLAGIFSAKHREHAIHPALGHFPEIRVADAGRVAQATNAVTARVRPSGTDLVTAKSTQHG